MQQGFLKPLQIFERQVRP